MSSRSQSSERFKLRKVKKANPPRQRAKKLPIKVRRKILELIDEGLTTAQIIVRCKRHRYTPTKAQVDAVRYGRVKTKATKRSDAHDSPEGATDPIRISNDPNHLIRERLIDALNVMHRKQTVKNAVDEIETLQAASLVNQRVTRASLMSNMGRRDAEVILEVIRMYDPTATESDAITIYKQAVDIVQRKEKDA